jgi:hypothetical protein
VEVSQLPVDSPHPVDIFPDLDGVHGLCLRMKCVLVSAAFGAYPVIGKIVESGSRFDTAVRVSRFGIIHVTAYFTDIPLHSFLLCLVV